MRGLEAVGRILVCGGRSYGNVPNGTAPEDYAAAKAKADAERVIFWRVMAPYADVANIEIIQGGADGADRCARDWASGSGHRCRTFEADWKAYGKGAGPMRNQRMLDEGRPDLVVAFPGGRGTADMMRRAKAAGARVIDAARLSAVGEGAVDG